ncbi:hypothetical protein HYV88_00245 [Candidatus Woesearchaeota archaeon]|nr:hypothetical protein [Candidatus Woesearchaeota archaeon]
METQTKKYEPRIIRGRIELWVPHQYGEIAFAPLTNLGDYQQIRTEILGDSERETNQRLPTGDETASQIHVAYCTPKPEIKNAQEYKTIRDIIRTNRIHVFNRIGWTFAGKYVLQDTTANATSERLDIDMLNEMLKNGTEINGVKFSTDGRVRFAPRETYKLGKHTPESLSLDGGVIAEYGIDGARKLAEVSKNFRYNTVTYGIEVKKRKDLEQRVSAFIGDVGNWLFLNGGYHGDSVGGCASGVWK